MNLSHKIIKCKTSTLFLHPTCAYHHDHTIHGMFIASTSSLFFASHLTVVMSWSHKVIVIFTSTKASRVPPWQCQNIHLEPTWTWFKLKQQASFTQGMSAPHSYPANILDQHHLTIPCTLVPHCLHRAFYQTRKCTSHKSHILVCFFIFYHV